MNDVETFSSLADNLELEDLDLTFQSSIQRKSNQEKEQNKTLNFI